MGQSGHALLFKSRLLSAKADIDDLHGADTPRITGAAASVSWDSQSTAHWRTVTA